MKTFSWFLQLSMAVSKEGKISTTEDTEFHRGEEENFKTPCSSGSAIKVFSSLSAAIESCKNYEKVFICGGETIYKEALSLANKIELTLIYGQHDGDRFFPEIDLSYWKVTETVNFDNFSFISYTKIIKD